jgi:2-octaprenyl-6-methoxyphenol hydroxylase
MAELTRLDLAVVGAGPVGMALALQAARQLPHARVALFDARPAERDLAADPRTLALSLGSVQALQALGAWPEGAGADIATVHVSQTPPPPLLPLAQAELLLQAAALGLPRLGVVLGYGALAAALQRAWLDAARAEPARLHTRLGQPVGALKPVPGGVEVDAGIAETFDLVVVAEGGVFAEQARKALAADYRQTAWVGTAELEGAAPGTAFERFTRQGPLALLPLPPLQSPSHSPLPPEPSAAAAPAPGSAGRTRAALVWCVDRADDPVRPLTDAQRIAVLGTLLPPQAGRVRALSPLKDFALGLNAERTLVDPALGGRVVRIGNAAQTLHPVAGQGLNLGLRDAHALVQALRRDDDPVRALARVAWERAPDRWSMIAATDFLARSFTWQLPGAASARALGLAALQALPPARHWLARRMMFGWR